MQIFSIKIISRVVFVTCSFGLLFYILYHNFSPLGTLTVLSTLDANKSIKLGPQDKIQTFVYGNELFQKLQFDNIYFQTDMPYSYDSATVKITFKNSNSNQPFYVGFQDDDIWHYNTQLIDMPMFNNLISSGWIYVQNHPSILQSEHKYETLDQLLNEPPENGTLGIYNFDQNIFRQTNIPGYTPSEQNTVIDVPLRGKITFYVYVDNESFKLKLFKQDLNYYPDPDTVSVRIYKENDIVYTAKIDDDGVTDDSGTSTPPQEVNIQNPGPGLPESGVYKVVIDASDDSVITKMITNLHKIVFASPIYPVSSFESYPKLINQTVPNTVYTDASEIKLITYHEGSRQKVQIASQSADLELKQELIATPEAQQNLTTIGLPKSDVVISGKLGNFAFSPDQYFQPTKIKLQNINNEEDLKGIKYIVTEYSNISNESEWKIANAYFDLNTAHVKNGKLSWILKAPGIKDNGNEIIVKSVEVLLTKKPIIKL